MRMVVCKDCGKRYDYDTDDFCPKCGGFNPPKKSWEVDARGNVVRVDGINERNHKNSFVHREVHEEKAERRKLGYDRRSTVQRGAKRRIHKYQSGGQKAGKIAATLIALIALLLKILLD